MFGSLPQWKPAKGHSITFAVCTQVLQENEAVDIPGLELEKEDKSMGIVEERVLAVSSSHVRTNFNIQSMLVLTTYRCVCVCVCVRAERICRIAHCCVESPIMFLMIGFTILLLQLCAIYSCPTLYVTIVCVKLEHLKEYHPHTYSHTQYPHTHSHSLTTGC